MNRNTLSIIGLLLLIVIPWTVATPVRAEVSLDGFMQALFGTRLDQSNPTSTEATALETRMQLRAEHYGDDVEFFGRLDFTWDGTDTSKQEFELREGYIKFRAGSNIDFKIGRQILTWGTGDLIFVNDLFTKDYQSFFIGRDDQYLKAPQTAVRMTWYNPVGALDFVWTPRFEPNRLPTGASLSYFSPLAGQIVGTGLNNDSTDYYFDVPTPKAKFENGEFAARLSKQLGYFNLAGYFYKGFYKNPMGMVDMVPVYPRLNVYGTSLRGQMAGSILWLEVGYYDSRDDSDGSDPMMPNSSLTGIIGFERQIATNLTVNAQWQVDMMFDHDSYEAGQVLMGAYIRDEVKHLITSRITKLLVDETLNLSGFVFYSPSEEDLYIRLNAEYKYTDELTLAIGANIFDGKNEATDFGQFQKNDNSYLKVTYGF